MFLRTFPLFLAILAASAAGLFNYQKMSSSVVSSTLYALRINDEARQLLGDEIYFASKVPWIWGTINQLHGKIDIHFGVKGNRAKGEMRFKSTRKSRMGFFETEEWSLEMGDGRVIDLLDKSDGDPFRQEDEMPESRAGKFI
jgi:cytochrome c oxidase assembly factor 1